MENLILNVNGKFYINPVTNLMTYFQLILNLGQLFLQHELLSFNGLLVNNWRILNIGSLKIMK